jgi:hypothetical protein
MVIIMGGKQIDLCSLGTSFGGLNSFFPNPICFEEIEVLRF